MALYAAFGEAARRSSARTSGPSALARACVAVCGAACVAAQASNPFSVKVLPSGQFALGVASWPDFIVSSSETAVVVNGVWTSSANGALVLDSVNTLEGADAWGGYNATVITWKAAGADIMYTSIRVYTDVPAVAFEQYFPTGVPVNGTYAARNNVSSVFPSIVPPTNGSNIGIMQWLGPFLDNGSTGPSFNKFTAGANIATGLSAGPMVFFNPAGTQSVVFSSLSNMMAGNVATDAAGNIRAGVFGSATSIPAGYRYETVMWYGNGINAAVMMWGAALLQRYGKHHELPHSDFTATHLSINTDHGAWFYYTTGPYPDYLAALTAVYEDAKARGIPYRATLLDSWWYFKGIGDGVKNWTAMPSVFPGGNAGIRNLTATTGWKVIAHNRFWAADTTYAKANGGGYDFYIDAPGSPAGGAMGVPLEQRFWEDLLLNATKEWGTTTYEQDWLFNLLEGVDLLTADPTAGRTWLLQMNAGAEAAGLTIQLCMSFPRHTLQSVEMSQVTQVRASDDHVPGLGYFPLQWRLGYSSLMAYSLAVAPFKDGFYSVNVEPGGSVGNSVETSPALQAAISVFSTGPVSPGDGVGLGDPVLLNRVCTASGRLLQPSRAATAIDNQIVNAVFPSATTANGEVYATYSVISGNVWDHVLAAAVNTSYAVSPNDLTAIRADLPVRFTSSGLDSLRLRPTLAAAAALRTAATLTLAYNTTNFAASGLKVQPFDAANPIALAPCGEVDFQLWHTAPVFANGWAYLGELAKFVPVAEARTVSVEVMGTDVIVSIMGQAAEAVALTFYNTATSSVTTVSCTLDAAGRATASVPAATCA